MTLESYDTDELKDIRKKVLRQQKYTTEHLRRIDDILKKRAEAEG